MQKIESIDRFFQKKGWIVPWDKVTVQWGGFFLSSTKLMKGNNILGVVHPLFPHLIQLDESMKYNRFICQQILVHELVHVWQAERMTLWERIKHMFANFFIDKPREEEEAYRLQFEFCKGGW